MHFMFKRFLLPRRRPYRPVRPEPMPRMRYV
jgi:hypothetical protein